MNNNFKKVILSSIVVFAGIGLIGCSNSDNVETLESSDTNVNNDSSSQNNDEAIAVNENVLLKESALNFFNYTLEPTDATREFVVSDYQEEMGVESNLPVYTTEEAIQKMEEDLKLSDYVVYNNLPVAEQLELLEGIYDGKEFASVLGIDYEYSIDENGFIINGDSATLSGNFIMITMPEMGTTSLGEEASLDFVKTEDGWKIDGQSAYNFMND